MSLFISFEGGEGSGKTTQAEMLSRRLHALGISSLLLHEPGSTQLGWYIRDWLKRDLVVEETMSNTAELFLFAAARAELVAKLIQPALDRQEEVIIADRYADSTTAYQGYGRRISLDYVGVVNDLATHNVMPDLTFLLDCSPEEGLGRVGSFQLRLPLEPVASQDAIQRDSEGTRFELEALEFHQRVREGYLHLAESDPKRWCVIDANQSPEQISEIVWRHVEEPLFLELGVEISELKSRHSMWVEQGQANPLMQPSG